MASSDNLYIRLLGVYSGVAHADPYTKNCHPNPLNMQPISQALFALLLGSGIMVATFGGFEKQGQGVVPCALSSWFEFEHYT